VPRQKRVFTPEYRADAVTLVLSGDRPIASIARDLGIGESTLGNWVATSRKNGSAASAERPLDLNERAELKRLREELRVARMERDFLKKRRPVQGVGATVPAIVAAGVAYPRVFRGRVLSLAAMVSRSRWV